MIWCKAQDAIILVFSTLLQKKGTLYFGQPPCGSQDEFRLVHHAQSDAGLTGLYWQSQHRER